MLQMRSVLDSNGASAATSQAPSPAGTVDATDHLILIVERTVRLMSLNSKGGTVAPLVVKSPVPAIAVVLSEPLYVDQILCFFLHTIQRLARLHHTCRRATPATVALHRPSPLPVFRCVLSWAQQLGARMRELHELWLRDGSPNAIIIPKLIGALHACLRQPDIPKLAFTPISFALLHLARCFVSTPAHPTELTAPAVDSLHHLLSQLACSPSLAPYSFDLELIPLSQTWDSQSKVLPLHCVL